MSADPNRTRPLPTAVAARAAAQHLAFAPLAFHAALAGRDLGLLTALREAGPAGLDSDQAAAATDLGRDNARILLEALVACDCASADERGRFRSTATGWWFERDAMTRVNADFVRDVCYRPAAHLAASLRDQAPRGLAELGPWATIYEGLGELDPTARRSWLAFDHCYSDAAFPAALERVFAQPRDRLLDVGGNTGRFACACLAYDQTVSVTLLDHPAQVEAAQAAVAEAGHSDRFAAIAGDLLDHDQPFPDDQSVVWMSQFLDCFPPADAIALLRRGTAALAPAGELFVLEPCTDRQRFAAGRDCLRLANLYFVTVANGRSRFYDHADLVAFATAAGLEVVATDDDLGLGHSLLRCRRAP